MSDLERFDDDDPGDLFAELDALEEVDLLEEERFRAQQDWKLSDDDVQAELELFGRGGFTESKRRNFGRDKTECELTEDDSQARLDQLLAKGELSLQLSMAGNWEMLRESGSKGGEAPERT